MLSQYSNKVDDLLVYMAQLEDKIKVEKEAREKLTRTYEASLNQGVNKLSEETSNLADNPLVKEISLLVAKQLI